MSYYLGRIDKLILGQDGKLKWIKGESSYRNYVTPKDEPNTMTIATVLFDPYSSDEQAIHINYAKHRRYTMDDIGNLDARLSNVEYYTALSLGEKATLTTNIIDQYGTRLKNGFIVEPFTNFTIVDLSDNNKNISIDLENNLARPSFSTKKLNVTASVDDLGDNSLIIENNLVRFNYTESVIASQDQATNSVKINQFDAISYKGDLKLSPQSDVWTEELAPVVNNVSDDTAAISKANQVPGLVFNEWSSFYASHQYVVDKAANPAKVKYDNVNYSVGTAIVTSTRNTEVNALTNNIMPKSRSIPIKFTATGLAPLTKMFVYVNGHLVNAYVTPDENPIGMITSAQITYPGTGYASTANATSNTASTTQAQFNLSVVAGSIDAITIVNPGKGYNTSAPISITIDSATVSNTANISLYTTPHQATQLYSNKSGTCSGTLQLPNSLVSFISGELIVMVCDTPHYDTENAISMARATFYTKTTFTQKVTDSIRYPYISKVVAPLKPKLPAQDSYIVVPTSLQYLVNDYKQSYTATKTGILSIPVYLSAQPVDAYGDPCNVVVTYVTNASSDKSANTTISSGTSSLTFTGSNWKTPQTISFSYDLGTKSNTGDNKLPTYIEFYAASDDGAYNFAGEKPFGYWKSTSFVYGVATTKLIPYNVYAPVVVPPQYPTPQLSMTANKSMSVGDEVGFNIRWSGDVGKDNKVVPNVYPLTFTLTYTSSGYSDKARINDATSWEYTVTDSNSHSFTATGLVAGTCGFTVTLSSTNSAWNGLSASCPFTVSASSLPALPRSIVFSNYVDYSLGIDSFSTTEGVESAIPVWLAGPAPTNDVTVAFASTLPDGGGSVVNSSLTFTSGNYAYPQLLSVKGNGYAGTLQQNIFDYNVNASSTSSDSAWNGKTASISLKNTVNKKPVASPLVDTGGQAVYDGPSTVTVCNATSTTVSIRVYLSAKPLENIYAAVTFGEPGVAVASNPILTFTPNDWNIPQTVILSGASTVSVDTNARVYLTTAYVSGNPGPWVKAPRGVAFLTNKTVAVPQTFFLSYQTQQKTYLAEQTGLPDANWKPTISISQVSATPDTYASFSLVETTPTSVKFNINGSFAKKPNVIKGAVIFTVSPGAEVDSSSASGIAGGGLTQLQVSATDPGGAWGAAINGTSAAVTVETVETGTSLAYQFSGTIIFSNLKRISGISAVNVTETTTTVTTTTTYRTDNYTAVGSPTTISSSSTQIVSPTLNARSAEAVQKLQDNGYTSTNANSDRTAESKKNAQAEYDSQQNLVALIKAKLSADPTLQTLYNTENSKLLELSKRI
jgi:hypothetical protein